MNEMTPYITDTLRKQTRNLTIVTIACIACVALVKFQNDKINTLTKAVEELKTKGE